MEKGLVSIIIPNYNAGIYLRRCIDSIYQQKYQNYEIILIDDGSTDNSLSYVKEDIENNKIKLIKQFNMNASIARNNGIKEARGEFLFFLDSDDEVTENGIYELVKAIKKADLALGSYHEIDDDYNNLLSIKLENKTLTTQDNVMKISGLSPVPSNKLYRSSIIKKNNLYFSNVNIAQDLSFYLKYLCYCDSVNIIENEVYLHRVVNSGMTKSKNFNIFDITKVFDQVYKLYRDNNKHELISKYLENVKFKHLFWQMNKQIKYKRFSERKLIIDYFCLEINKIVITNKDFNNIKRDLIIYKFNNNFRILSATKIYSNLFKKILKNRKIVF